MSFATEVTQYKSTAGKEALAHGKAEAAPSPPVAAVPAAPVEAPPAVPATMPKHGEAYDEAKFSFDQGLPAGSAPVDSAVAKPAEVPKSGEAPAPEATRATASDATSTDKPKAPIKIGTQEFQTIDEAVEYAKQLEAAAQADKAYIEGLKDGKPKAEEAPVKTAEEIFAEKVFEDPIKAAKDFRESIKNEIRQEYNSSLQAQHQAQQAANTKAAAWDSFYKENADLSSPETRDILENHLIQKFTKDGTLKPTDPHTKFAELARKQLKIVKQSTLPTTELPKGPIPMTAATGNATPQATVEKVEETVDMVTALNRMRRRSK